MRLSRSSINFLFVRTRGRWGENEIGRERERKEALSICMIIVWLLYEAVIFIFHASEKYSFISSGFLEVDIVVVQTTN